MAHGASRPSRDDCRKDRYFNRMTSRHSCSRSHSFSYGCRKTLQIANDRAAASADDVSLAVIPRGVCGAGHELVMSLDQQRLQGFAQVVQGCGIRRAEVLHLVRVGCVVKEFFLAGKPFHISVAAGADASPLRATASRSGNSPNAKNSWRSKQLRARLLSSSR